MARAYAQAHRTPGADGDPQDRADALAEDGFELLESPAGLWAMVDVAPRNTADGYRAIFDGWFQERADYAMEGDPYLERHGTTSEGAAVVTVCVRVRPVVEEGDFNMAVVPLDGAMDTAL